MSEIPVDVFAAGSRSEQAMVHSAPSPSTVLFELKVNVNLFPLELKLVGPFFWQNLGNQKIDVNWCKKNLLFPRVRKSPFLPLQ